ncbi:unnamed protein product [Adineta ricciae]|uniref:Uncharacterized protein n=1 Tax=Adineta ricciae TaxID=249248 RepID=A0A813WEW0_ADIRI|nr:unnamed protein product [Adineta ricciae]CAF0910638.1 unnamed protein product [Adineta ricciae]
MKSIFNNQIVRMVRDEVSDLRKKNTDTKPNQETQPTFYHCPASATSTTDSYSHTASSTAGYSQTGTYPSLPTEHQHQHRERQSLIGKIESTKTNLGNMVEDAFVNVTNKFNGAVTIGRNARELLRNGAIVQLVSKHSGHLLQIVMSSNGTLIFDGNGLAGSFNTYFTVEEGTTGRLRLHNNYNYLAFEDKQPSIISLPPGPKNNVNIDFRVHDIIGSSELVAFESCAYKNCFISILGDGHLKTTHIKEKNIDAQFSILSVPVHQPPVFPQQVQPYQQYNMNPYGGQLHNSANPYLPPQSSMPGVQPSAPPPPSYDEAVSSSLYPQIK